MTANFCSHKTVVNYKLSNKKTIHGMSVKKLTFAHQHLESHNLDG